MHDQPDPAEILAAGAAFLRREAIPALPADLAFKVRVLANALDLVARQVAQPEQAAAAAKARLAALVGDCGDEHAMTALLAQRIEKCTLPLGDPALLEHLWATTLAKLAVDQPAYASFLAETDNGGHSPSGN